MKTSTKFTGLAAALAITMALAGCVGSTDTVPTTPPSSTTAPTTEPTPATPAIDLDALENGAVLTPEEAAAVEADRERGYHAYELPDGTKVLTSYRGALPEAVKVDVARKIAESGTSVDGAVDKYAEGVKAAVSETGRNLIAVVPVTAACNFEDMVPSAAWMVVTARDYLYCTYHQTDAVTWANSYRDSQNTPADWDVVVRG